MREAKYRAWDKANNYMVESFKVQDIEAVCHQNEALLTGCCTEDSWYNFILMEYTGKKDKNGLIEICEEDIVKMKYLDNEYDSPLQEIIGRVYYNQEKASFAIALSSGLNLPIHDCYSIEVIGNTWENKNLIK